MHATTLAGTSVTARQAGKRTSKACVALTGLGVVLALAAGTLAVADALYNRQVSREIAAMFNQSRGVSGIVTEADLAPLPKPVQRWLRYSGVVDKERVSSVRLKMVGQMRQSAEQGWFPIEAEEYYATNPPALVWSARATMAPGVWMRILDNYAGGHGGLRVKLFSLITVADASGPGIDQGTLLRYLNEIMWFPAGALSDYIRWEPVDDVSAKATMSYGGVTASATFVFDERGALVNMISEGRYRDASGTYDHWETPIQSYGEFAGVRIPTKGEAVWKLDTGDFSYGRLEITGVEYDIPSQY